MGSKFGLIKIKLRDAQLKKKQDKKKNMCEYSYSRRIRKAAFCQKIQLQWSKAANTSNSWVVNACGKGSIMEGCSAS